MSAPTAADVSNMSNFLNALSVGARCARLRTFGPLRSSQLFRASSGPNAARTSTAPRIPNAPNAS
eukprot:5268153-Lingulodinium_polyedra.AAC.1